MSYKDPEKQKEAQQRYEEKRKGKLHRAWTGICYPDSMPANYDDYFSGLHLPVYLGPLHDCDTWTQKDQQENPDHIAGKPKKSHYHYLVVYPHGVDRETFLADFKWLNAPVNVKYVRDLVAMVRYLVHKDDPQKAQYNPDDIKYYGGADNDLVNQLGTAEKAVALKEMRKYIVKNQIVDFWMFAMYCDDCMSSWARLLNESCTYVITQFINSYRAYCKEQLREQMQQVSRAGCLVPPTDPATGEIREGYKVVDDDNSLPPDVSDT